MLRLAFFFFIVAILTALFGFGGVAVTAVSIAKFLFYLFTFLCVTALVAALMISSDIPNI